MRLTLALAFALLNPALSRAGDIPAMPARASLIAESPAFSPGQAITVALRLQRDSGWHTYWQDPGDAGLPTELKWSLPPGFKAGPLLWPKPKTFKEPGGLVGYGYTGDSLLLIEIKVPKSYASKTLKLQADASWLVCREVCIPGSAKLALDIPAGPTAPDPAYAALFADARASLGQLPEDYKGSAGYVRGICRGGPRAPQPVPEHPQATPMRPQARAVHLAFRGR